MSLNFYLQKIYTGTPLSESEAAAACEILMQQELGTATAGAFLTALALQGETAEQLVGMALNMRARSTPLESTKPTVDIISAGTSGAISAVAIGAGLLLAAAGVNVAKLVTPIAAHNAQRSADIRNVAATLGIAPMPGPTTSAAMLEKAGFALVDPADHIELMRSVRAHQESLPIPTVFDRLMPLAHPAPATSLLVGVGQSTTAQSMAQALRRLRVSHAIVLATDDGTCPFTAPGKVAMVQLTERKITEKKISAADVDLDLTLISKQTEADTEKQGAWLRALLDGRDTPINNAVVWTAALGLLASGNAKDIKTAVAKIQKTLTSHSLGGVVALVSRKAA